MSNHKKYPKNWKTEIRPAILKRANNCCEHCGVQNDAVGYRDKNDVWNDIEKSFAGDMDAEDAREKGYKVIQIVLKITHLDYDVTNNDFSNLKALCQRCHNCYNAVFRKIVKLLKKCILTFSE